MTVNSRLKPVPLKRGGSQLQRTRLAPVSARRRAENRQRRAIAAVVYAERPVCAVLGCGRWADDIHETLSRARSGGVITDPSLWAALCRPHHREITDTEPGWAYEQGLLIHSWEAA